MHAVAHQRMRGIEQTLHLRLAVVFLAMRDVAAGEFQVVEDAVGIRPLLEDVVVLEEVVVAERGVGDHQRLHRGRVLLHDVADAWIGVDHDLIGEPLHAGAVHRLVAGEVLAERPVLVEQRHADRGIGIQHLLGADDLDLVGIYVQPKLADRDLLDRVMHALDGAELPVRTLEQRTLGPHATTKIVHAVSAPVVACFLANSSRNTG